MTRSCQGSSVVHNHGALTSSPSLRLWQRLVGRALAAVAVLLCADSIALSSTGAPDGFVPLLVRGHLLLGAAFAVLLTTFAALHLVLHVEHGNTRARQRGVVLLAVLGVGVATGVALWSAGKSAALRWLVLSHEVAFVSALVAYIVHRLAATLTPILRGERLAASVTLALAAAVLLVTPEDAPEPAVMVERTVFEPGATRARSHDGHTLDAEALADSDYCAQCHPDVAKQWQGSAHRHSSFTDPFYAATFAKLQEHATPEATRFCGGCHDPLVVFAGKMDGSVDRESEFAQDGITCLVCHGVIEVRGREGTGGYVLRPPVHYPYYGSEDPTEQEQNRQLIVSRPELHKQTLLDPDLHRDPSFCLPCHKAHLPPALNGERWRRGQNDWDAWLDSSASMRSARTFFHREDVKRCQDCHMQDVPSDDPAARDGKIRSHRFASANTALATVHKDEQWLTEIRKVLEGAASIDIFSLSPADAARIYPLDAPGVFWPRGAASVLEVVVRNTKTGHLFPAGTLDLAEVWVELTIEVGGRRLRSGWLDERGDLDRDAHRLHAVLLDGQGDRLRIHEVEEMRAVLYNRAVQLGTSDVVRFQVPPLDGAGPVVVRARLLHRKFPQDYVRFALGDDAPEMPIVVVAENAATLTLDAGEPRVVAPSEENAARMLDFGIGSLLSGDTRSARSMFAAVSAIRPTDPDPEVFFARAALSDGALDEAEQHLRLADARRPGWWKTAFTLGKVRLGQGRLEEAVATLERVLGRFPEDRVVLTDVGGALLDLGRPADAKAMFERALKVDPEDVDARSGLGRALLALGDEGGAREQQAEADRVRPPREELHVAGTYRAAHSEADREASDPHIHPLEEAPGSM